MEIRVISSGDALREIGAQAFLDFINPFVGERAYLTIDEPASLHDEKEWIEARAREIDSGYCIFVVLLDGNILKGNCEARRGRWKERNNVHFGIGISRDARGGGYGRKLLTIAMAEAQKAWSPRKLWIECVEGNEIAYKLYVSMGFHEIGKLPEYINHFGEWKAKILMEYRGMML
jgi:RimJ/RimL family protein N-acetyltransferase